jgi:ribonuclease HI
MLKVYFDGASRGNPGKAGAGIVVINDRDEIVGKICSYLGEKTNNQAEYLAVLLALDYLQANDINDKTIELIGDSQLVIKQLRGEYKIKDEKLKDLYWQIREYIVNGGFNIKFSHVKREKNKLADEMANKALDDNER